MGPKGPVSSWCFQVLQHLGSKGSQCPPPDVCCRHLEGLRDALGFLSFVFFFCFIHCSVFTEHPALLQRRLLGPRGLGHPSRLGVVSRLCSQMSTWGATWSSCGQSEGKAVCPLHTGAGAAGMFPGLLRGGELKASLSAWPGQLHRPLPGQSHHLWVPSTPRQPWPTLVSPPQTPSPSLLIPV